MAFRKTFVLSDESVNTYGFWVRTEGIRLENAKKNCPAYFNHRTWEVPLGHWENLRVNDKGQLLGDIVIEGGNDVEKDMIRKIENGDIKAASVGLDPITWNDAPEQLKFSQYTPTLDECELFEASLAPLPGNKNALALKTKDGFVTLSAENSETIIPQLKQPFDMKKIALKLGLSENASEAEVLEALNKVLLNSENAEAMRQHIEGEASNELDSEEKKTLFVELSKTNFKQALSFLKLNKKPAEQPAAGGEAQASSAQSGGVKKDVKVTDLIQKGKSNLSKAAGEDEEKECFDYLQKHNPVELSRIRKEDPERYTALAKDYQNGKRYKK
jgi:HK97 family phage prohead protease